ncbi:MAG: PQQ-dependent sugar dehydrogenase [Candidatus Kapabacteria bacterium]|nr:PQQ-dependent sugar dehydrogenase [Ignavibacteriota bacterium]MCW5884971.1 PQQ-dependent sugar dehydrogenase [Candidatus Kapabacteria bacterium]
MKTSIIILSIILLNMASIFSQTELQTREVAGNFRTVWEVLWGSDNHLWITERFGRISRLNPQTGETYPLITIADVFENGERGLLGMDLHPDFENNPYVYVAYNYGSTNQNTRVRIVRYTYNGSSLSEPLILLDDIKGWWNHNGARIRIDNELKLWFTMGDAADISLPQKTDNVNGKLCRMNLDGSVPDDNPFPGSYVWSYGHRNQQGLVLVGDNIYTSEHGASVHDEINLIHKGRNYGWPNVEGFCETASEKIFCEQNNVVEPILSLYPNYTLAIAGMDYYNHDLIPEWKNSLLITALKTELVVIAKLNEAGDKVIESFEMFKNQFGRLRDICVSPDGRVYIATSNQDGRGSNTFRNTMDKIIEISPKGSSSIFDDTENFIISPNPTSDYITISFSNKGLQPFVADKVQIFDMLGMEVISTPSASQPPTGEGNLRIDVSHLPAGVYFIKINCSNGACSTIEKFVKQL